MRDIREEYVHLTRAALQGKVEDVAKLAQRNLKNIEVERGDLAEELRKLVLGFQTLQRSTSVQPVPIDIDSKLELVHAENPIFQDDPIWSKDISAELLSILQEREYEEKLIVAGLTPTRSILFVGPPGVGKTLAAKWLAFKLGRPLFTLDLAAVMSSFLGRTGNNIRAVLDYAKKIPSVLLLDEFDAVAKRRNDDSEIGELKRLVTVLLQAVDEWPAESILIAATNHPELLDPAVWRRFERIIVFPNPARKEIEETLLKSISDETLRMNSAEIEILAIMFEGDSFSEINRKINLLKKECIINNLKISEAVKSFIKNYFGDAVDKKKKINMAVKLVKEGEFSQRRVSEITGIARGTIQKYLVHELK